MGWFSKILKKKQAVADQQSNHNAANKLDELESQFLIADGVIKENFDKEAKELWLRYKAEYDDLSNRFEKADKKTDKAYLDADKELDEKYKLLSTALGMKYAVIKNKYYLDFTNTYSEAYFKSRRTNISQLDVSLEEKANEVVELIKEQKDFDELLQRINRELFFLPTRITREEYLKKLGNIKYKEIKHHSNIRSSLEFNYDINWPKLISLNWINKNFLSTQHFETPVKLTTTFKDNLLNHQILSFENKFAAEMFFELFKNNSNWDFYKVDETTPAAKSPDGNYIVALAHTPPEEEDSFFSPPIFNVHLTYKNPEL